MPEILVNRAQRHGSFSPNRFGMLFGGWDEAEIDECQLDETLFIPANMFDTPKPTPRHEQNFSPVSSVSSDSSREVLEIGTERPYTPTCKIFINPSKDRIEKMSQKELVQFCFDLVIGSILKGKDPKLNMFWINSVVSSQNFQLLLSAFEYDEDDSISLEDYVIMGLLYFYTNVSTPHCADRMITIKNLSPHFGNLNPSLVLNENG